MLKIKDILIIGIAVLLVGCSSDDIMTGGGLEASPNSDEWDIKPGDPVAFTLLPSVKAQTRAKEKDDSFDSYAAIENGYELTIEMFGTGEASKGSAVYSVTDGTLNPKIPGSQLYWLDNTQAYGFKATAGTTTLETDQSNATKLRSQDRLEGYAFVPLKDGTTRQYTEDALNYRTSKQWKADNATFGKTGEDLKKIPLYLKHKRSKITIILKAGDGVESDDLAYATAATKIDATIYSYSGGETIAVKPCVGQTTISAKTYTQYTAIVEPYDYTTETTLGDGGKIIAQITLKGSGSEPDKIFTYKPSNGTGTYSLTAGQHLTITITLTTN